MKAIPIGTNNFSKLIEGNYYFVEFLERKSAVTLITRPRRFGKTMNMSMLAEFFDITKDSKEIFEDTKIMDTPYASEINQYPTIFLSFADAKGDKKSVVSMIKNQLIMEWKRLRVVFADLDEFDRPRYEYLMKSLTKLDDYDLEGINNAISFLMERLKSYYGKDVMVFIDEYDTPFVEAHVNGFYEEVRGGLAALLHNSLKTSNCLKYAMLTGIQRVAKENIFSDLNNLVVYTVKDKEYGEYFGFSVEETKELLEYYQLELDDKVKDMYDGYKMGDAEIYNPWSILNYTNRKQLIPYWVNTSANTMLKQAISSAKNDFKEQYEELIQNGYLETELNLQTSFYEVANTPNLWGLFINAGYLTIDKVIDAIDGYYRIRIPNKEVNTEFRNLTEYYLSLDEGQLNRIARCLVKEELEEFQKEYQNILMLPSYHDLTNENSYHMMMLGMCVSLSNHYKVISNREEGRGRCDLIIQAKDEKRTSFVIEFKYLKEEKNNIKDELNRLSEEAIRQIQERNYDHDLTGKVIYIGLAHHGKDVVMKWMER